MYLKLNMQEMNCLKKIQVQPKLIPILLAAALLAVGLFGLAHLGLFSLGHKSGGVFSQGPVRVTVTPVGRITKAGEIVLPGTIQSREAVIISAEISGRISQVQVTSGQTVNTGQTLVHIEGTKDSNQSQAAPAVAATYDAEAAQQAQARVDALAKEYERYEKLYQMGGIARRQLEDTAARLQAAREALSNAPSNTQSSLASRQPNSATLIAPSGGVVTELVAAAGKTVQAGQQLMVLDNGGAVRVVIHLEQKDLYFVKAGTPAEITLDSTPGQNLQGQVEAVYPEPGTGAQTFLTHIQVGNTDNLLKQGVPIKVHLKTNQSVTVAALPANIVRQDQGGSYVYLAVDGKAVRQPVTTGTAVGDWVELTSPLPEQASIISSNLDNLQEGTPVVIQ